MQLVGRGELGGKFLEFVGSVSLDQKNQILRKLGDFNVGESIEEVC